MGCTAYSEGETRSMKNKHLHIVFCGIDGSGKSTWAKIVSDEFRRLGEPVSYIHGHTYAISANSFGLTGERMNTLAKWFKVFWPLALCDNLYTFLTRYRPVLRSSHLITDRYFYDKLVRLRFYGIIPEKFFSFYMRLLPKPDYVFFLDVDPKIAYKRKADFRIEEYKMLSNLYRNMATLLDSPVINTSYSIISCQKKIFHYIWSR